MKISLGYSMRNQEFFDTIGYIYLYYWNGFMMSTPYGGWYFAWADIYESSKCSFMLIPYDRDSIYIAKY